MVTRNNTNASKPEADDTRIGPEVASPEEEAPSTPISATPLVARTSSGTLSRWQNPSIPRPLHRSSRPLAIDGDARLPAHPRVALRDLSSIHVLVGEADLSPSSSISSATLSDDVGPSRQPPVADARTLQRDGLHDLVVALHAKIPSKGETQGRHCRVDFIAGSFIGRVNVGQGTFDQVIDRPVPLACAVCFVVRFVRRLRQRHQVRGLRRSAAPAGKDLEVRAVPLDRDGHREDLLLPRARRGVARPAPEPVRELVVEALEGKIPATLIRQQVEDEAVALVPYVSGSRKARPQSRRADSFQ
mmetsp:Transcript_13195/g.28019  ORF Transcript_13195/g.28019 Transcript_13195/m.28019 type:complete len:302 (+) Transcript_13195:450-1355(+)